MKRIINVGSYEIDVVWAGGSFAVAIVVGLAVGYTTSALASSTVCGSSLSSDSYCSITQFSGLPECPSSNFAFSICKAAFEAGAGAFSKILEQDSSFAGGWPQLNADPGISCTLPLYNHTAYPDCASVAQLLCDTATWGGFFTKVQPTCSEAVAVASKATGAFAGTLLSSLPLLGVGLFKSIRKAGGAGGSEAKSNGLASVVSGASYNSLGQ